MVPFDNTTCIVPCHPSRLDNSGFSDPNGELANGKAYPARLDLYFGGIWEAAVNSVKHHLRRIIGDQVLTFSELATLMCHIEAYLNSRPSHFLIQRSSFIVPEGDVTNDNVPAEKRWLLISQVTQHFWARWSNEYLTSLQSRMKWRQPQPPVTVGELVLVRNELTPPAKWPIARISAIHPGRNGFTRVVDLHTASTTLRRPIAKVVRLQP